MDLDYELEELLQEQLYENGLPPLHVAQVQKLANYTMRAYRLEPKRTSLDRLYACMKEFIQTPFGRQTLAMIGKDNKPVYNNVLSFRK